MSVFCFSHAVSNALNFFANFAVFALLFCLFQSLSNALNFLPNLAVLALLFCLFQSPSNSANRLSWSVALLSFSSFFQDYLAVFLLY